MRSLNEVYERLENQPFVAEFKYDGQRAQIHATTIEGCLSEFKMFSRHLEDMTSKVQPFRFNISHLTD
jgi:DNA ligase-1